MLDRPTKEMIDYSVSATSKTSDWLDALNMAVNQRFPDGIRSKQGKPKLITDNAFQPTSNVFSVQ